MNTIQVLTTLAIILWFIPQGSLASSLVKNNELFCDNSKTLCIKGTISVHPNKGTVHLRARVKGKTRPGYLRITLHGYQKNRTTVAYIQGRVRGKNSEIIDLKNGATQHSDTRWVMHRFEYLEIE